MDYQKFLDMELPEAQRYAAAMGMTLRRAMRKAKRWKQRQGREKRVRKPKPKRRSKR